MEPDPDVPIGEARWLTVVSPAHPDGVELLLDPDGHPAAGPFQSALVADGVPFTRFAVDDVHAEVERLKELGVGLTQDATGLGPVDRGPRRGSSCASRVHAACGRRPCSPPWPVSGS